MAETFPVKGGGPPPGRSPTLFAGERYHAALFAIIEVSRAKVA